MSSSPLFALLLCLTLRVTHSFELLSLPRTSPSRVRPNPPLSTDVHLFSVLRPNYDEDSSSPLSEHRRFWSWKLDVMGLAMTRKDYLRHRFSERIIALCPEIISEAIVISNCKRVEIVVATDASADVAVVAGSVASLLEGWVSTWEKEKRDSNVTEPTGLGFNASSNGARGGASKAAVPDYLSTLSGVEDVSRYLCRVAAGLPPEAPPYVFSPYLSRDAHVLKQLKQAFSAASSSAPAASSEDEASSGAPLSPPPCRGRLGALMRGCLEAGKAVRDPVMVPELLALRPSLKASYEERGRVAEAACRKGIEPAVARSVAAFVAIDRGRIICELREKARSVAVRVARDCGNFSAVRDLERGFLSLAVRRELHEPMLALRHGRKIDETEVLERVAKAML